jgi:phosphatidylinositol-4-phosphate 3-kinase
MLPRESRLVLCLYGRSLLPQEKDDEEPKLERTELGWTALQIFNCEGQLAQGSFLLSLWPVESDKRLGPAPASGIHPQGDTHPVFGITLQEWGSQVQFPNTIEDYETPVLDFSSLDEGTQEQLLVIAEQDTFTKYILNLFPFCDFS